MEVKGKGKYVDNTAKEVEMAAERKNNKTLYQLNKVTESQITLSGNVSNKQKRTLTQRTNQKVLLFKD